MLKNNTALKIVSVVIAILLWMYVMGEINPVTTQTIEDIPVELLNKHTLEDKGLAIRDSSEFTVDIVVEGRRAKLHALDRSQIEATADLFGYAKGKNYIPVAVNLPEGIALKEVKTPRIQVMLEELISAYKSIDVAFEGNTKSGTMPKDLSVSPAEVEIRGARSLVNAVESVRVLVNAQELTDDMKSCTARPMAVSKAGKPIKGIDMSASAVKIEAALYYIKSVPLKIDVNGSVPEAFQVAELFVPKKITIRGMKSVTDKIESITADPVDISKVTESCILPIAPQLPAGVELDEKSEKTGVKVTLEDLDEKTIRLSAEDCQIKHLGNGLSASVGTAEIAVTVTGGASMLSHTGVGDFLVSVDLANLKEGKHTVAVKVTSDKKFKTMKIAPEKVSVTISGHN